MSEGVSKCRAPNTRAPNTKEQIPGHQIPKINYQGIKYQRAYDRAPNTKEQIPGGHQIPKSKYQGTKYQRPNTRAPNNKEQIPGHQIPRSKIPGHQIPNSNWQGTKYQRASARESKTEDERVRDEPGPGGRGHHMSLPGSPCRYRWTPQRCGTSERWASFPWCHCILSSPASAAQQQLQTDPTNRLGLISANIGSEE